MNNRYALNQISVVEVLIKLGEDVHQSKSGKYYWKRHKSILFNGHTWYRISNNTRGYALDLMVMLLGYQESEAIAFLKKHFDLKIQQTDYKLYVPVANTTHKNIKQYLTMERFLDESLVDYFIEQGLLMEDAKYHNCNFLGMDENGEIKHIHVHTTTSHFELTKYNKLGSNGAHSFHFIGSNKRLYVFESAIDMLSYITMHQQEWQENSYVSLCGVDSVVIDTLQERYHFEELVLCLDNDFAGQEATAKLMSKYKEQLIVNVHTPGYKDFNEDLKAKYNQPVLRGIKENFEVQWEQDIVTLLTIAKHDKDKRLQDLLEVYSFFIGNIKSKNPKWKRKAIESLLEMAKVCVLLARQQGRHFELRQSLESLCDTLRVEQDYMKYHDEEKYPKMMACLTHVKMLLYNQIYHTKEQKEELIGHYMMLAKHCLTTHVVFILEEEKRK